MCSTVLMYSPKLVWKRFASQHDIRWKQLLHLGFPPLVCAAPRAQVHDDLSMAKSVGSAAFTFHSLLSHRAKIFSAVPGTHPQNNQQDNMSL